jgi:hypothetical protein
MGFSVQEWVERYCDTMEDATSLRIMRGKAFAGASEAIEVLACLPEDDPWIDTFTADRDKFVGLIDRIEARLDALGLPYGRERHYGVTSVQADRVDAYRESLR